MTDLLLFLATVTLVMLIGRFSEEIGERLWRPKVRVPCQEWREMVEPIVEKCRLSATFNGSTTFNTEGSSALAALLEKMATELDHRS